MGRYRLEFDVLIIPFQAVSFLNDKTKSRANALDFVYSLRTPDGVLELQIIFCRFYLKYFIGKALQVKPCVYDKRLTGNGF